MRFDLKIVFILCVGFIDLSYGQEYNYRNYTIEDGLPSMTLYNFDEDSKGFIWVAHENGISKFDGYNFTKPNIDNGLIHKEVTNIFIDSKDRVWLITAGPLCYVHKNNLHQFSNLPSPNHLRSAALQEDVRNNIWYFNSKSISVLDGENLEVLHTFDPLVQRHDLYSFIAEKGDTTLIRADNWIYFLKDYLIVDSIQYDQSLKKSKSQRQLFPQLRNNILYYCKVDQLWQFNLATKENKFLRKFQDNIYDILITHNKLYAQIDNRLLFEFDLNDVNSFVQQNIPIQLSDSGTAYIDSKNNIWVPTYKDGIILIQEKNARILKFFSQELSFNGYLECVLNDPEGNTWIGGANGKLYKISNGALTEVELMGSTKSYSSRILCLNYLGKNKILVGGDDGIWLIDNNKVRILTYGAIKDISIQKNEVLISTSSNTYLLKLEYLLTLDKFNLASIDENNSEITIIKNKRSLSNAIFASENYWVGNELDGLVNFNKGKLSMFKDSSELFLSSITDIEVIDNDFIAVATKGAGVFIINSSNEYIRITEGNGLSSNICQDISTYNNNLYIGTNQGLNILNYKDLFNKDFDIQIIDISNGLYSNEIRSVSVNKDSIFLATTQGLEILDKNYFNPIKSNIPIYITSFKINGQEQILGNNYELNSDQNDIEINYVALDYGNESNLLYEYKLEGYDSYWIKSKDITVKYNNLLPGYYDFKIRLVQNKENVQLIHFHIHQPFYNRLWFKTAVAIFMSLVLIGLLYAYSLRKQKSLLNKLVDIKTRELDQQLNVLATTNKRLEKSNEDLQNFAYVTSHDLKSPLRSIGSFLQLLEKKNKEKFDDKDRSYIKFSIDGVNRMYQTINDLLDYSALNTETSPVTLGIKEVIQDVIKDLNFEIKNRNVGITLNGEYPTLNLHYFKIKQVFQNIIQNGIKYNKSEIPLIDIFCNEFESHYQFKIQDNGIGIEKDYHQKIFKIFKRLHNDEEYQGTGVGLAICKRVIESYGGNIEVDSKENEGSTFKFTLPKSLES